MASEKILAIYPSSFNPFTIGHLNILEKAEAIFGKENVVVLVGVNQDKIPKETLKAIQDYNQKEKDIILNNIKNTSINRLKAQIPSKNVDGFTGFLTSYVDQKEKEGYKVVVIRGLRNGSDLDYEYNQTRYMWDQKPDLKIVYIPCDPLYSHVSSSAYRALEAIEKGAGQPYFVREENV